VSADLERPNSAEHCGRCHRTNHEAWKTSSHAQAMESRLFQDALESAEQDSGPAVRKLCLGCHAPVAVETDDLALRYKVSWEGVTCDYCHSIREVSSAGVNARARVEFGLLKLGPLKDSVPTAHRAVFSKVHTSSAVCAPCHEYRNEQGFAVLTTSSEWKASRYAAEGKPCQSCHMYRVAGELVDPRIQQPRRSKVDLHQMPGSHSLDQLTKTIKARLSTARQGDRLQVQVEVANAAAGHHVPTGSPLRQVVLELRVEAYNGTDFREERVYRRAVADRHGVVIEREHLAFLKGAQVVSDTRLQSDEKRTESFSFPIPPGIAAEVKAAFWYYYSPLARTEAQKRVKFLAINRLAP
jgi:hypothetical protein